MGTRYQREPYLKKTTSTVASAFEEEDGRFCVALSDSIFYPQGGGQKGDRGSIRVGDAMYNVVDTVKDALSADGRPLCILDRPAPDLVAGQKVEAELDWPHRYAQMRLHSIVHLHHCFMEEIADFTIPVPATSDLNADFTAFNRYETGIVTESLATQAFEKMKALIQSDAPIQTRDDPDKDGFRYWECLDFSIPCGGTHLSNIAEVGQFTMSFSCKKGKPKISFALK